MRRIFMCLLAVMLVMPVTTGCGEQGPDGAIYVFTSNRDGRGSVNPGNDQILRISPK